MDWHQLHRRIRDRLESLTSPEEAQSEARIWLEDGFQRSLDWLALHGTETVSSEDQQQLQSWLDRRSLREPCQYLWGRTRFRERSFRCDARVLIPRPETELLIEEALARRSADRPLQVWDVGTGSGILAITLALETSWIVTASDLSPDALACAQQNALDHRAPVHFIESDLLEAASGSIDMVVSNLPYVDPATHSQLQPELHFEPSLALYASEQGEGLITRLLRDGRRRSIPLMLLEIGAGQADRLRSLAHTLGWPQAETLRDWNGHDRVLVAEDPSVKTDK